MADDDLFNVDVDDAAIQTQQVLLAAAHHDLESLRTLFRTTSAAVQDPETGYSPLHTAIAANVDESPSPASNGRAATSQVHTNGNRLAERPEDDGEKPEKIVHAEKTLRLLFQNGAVWNELDANGETPGCLAWRLGFKSLYEIVVDAGVRAELLLNRMDEFELLADGEESDVADDDDDDGRADGGGAVSVSDATDHAAITSTQTDSATPTPQITIETETPAIAHATAAQYSATSFLASELTFQDGRILDSDRAGVMMAWETGIMRKTASLLLPSSGLRVLNIGHGMGIIDGIFQDHENRPASHHIVEAHPQVLAKMRENGWFGKDAVTVHEGRWQDVLPKLTAEGESFDVIYFDTFAEDYQAFREFFSEFVIGLLEPGGSWSFFHGLGADRRVVYDVYTKVVEMDLFEAGFDTEWETVEVPSLEQAGEWNGVQRPYWTLDVYRLPICRFID